MFKELVKLTLDNKSRELEPRGTPSFPCGAYFNDIRRFELGVVPWHWHDEVEVSFIASGEAHFSFNGLNVTLHEGDGIFINSNALHTTQSVSGSECTYYTAVFGTSLISGALESIFERRYVNPLLRCTALPAIPFCEKTCWHRQAVQLVWEACQLCNSETFGYELFVREKLSRLWLLIVENMQTEIKQERKAEAADSIRLKIMLDFLHQRYNEQIELGQIAKSANISMRECLRCFQKTIGMPPIQYLLKYRVLMAARLLEDTSLPITEICSQSGFDSSSYFSKTFRRIMHCSPSDYRKKPDGSMLKIRTE